MSTTQEGFTQLYRHWDDAGRLLYVGISYHALYRLSQHSKVSHWYKDITRVTLENYSCREEALSAERNAIQSEKPLYNIVHVQGVPAADILKRAAYKQSEISRHEMLLNMVVFKPLYKLGEAAQALGMNSSTLRQLCESGKITSIPTGSRPYKNKTTGEVYELPTFCLTGWAIIDYLETLEGAAA